MAVDRASIVGACLLAGWVAAVSARVAPPSSTTASLESGQQQTAISFSRTVYPIFEAAQCRGCHNEDGVASATRLHFPDANASPGDIEAFGLTLSVLIDRSDLTRSLLLNKPTNRERHTGGVRIKPDGAR